MKHKRILIFAAALLLLFGGCAVYVQTYYRALPAAADALLDGDGVRVEETAYGWRFDGPGEEAAMIFYPGGKVEETAYAPLMRTLAADGLDACLVRMPFRLAIFGVGQARDVMARHDYDRWYIGGHSLGGVTAAMFAARQPETLDGVVMLAAYANGPLDAELPVLWIVGEHDGVLNRDKYEQKKVNCPRGEEYVIPGGNHAGFGLYGPQSGDGEAGIPAAAQIRKTADRILAFTKTG